jgi:UDP-glucose:(heptosyl)LPS alpha-1,3-glucosyltransferase
MTGSSPPFRIALAIFRLQPAGGLEQHCLRLAGILARRGAAVTLVTTRPPETSPSGVTVVTLKARGFSNHRRLANFAEDAGRRVAAGFDRTVAFHAIPGFEMIVCADPSRGRPPIPRRWLPRYRTYAGLEDAAMGTGTGSARLVLTLSGAQRGAFIRNHYADPARFILLPPTVDRRRARPTPTAEERAEARRALGLTEGGPVWLWIGLQPRTKGLDRALTALAAEPGARLIVSGLDPRSRAGAAMERRAARLGVRQRIVWLGFAAEAALTQAFAAADLLLHPSRADVTGTVILEAMASGLPVITTAVCGYGEHVASAGAGVVLAEPFQAGELRQALAAATPQRLATWSANAAAYAGRDALYSGLDRAADLILGPLGP